MPHDQEKGFHMEREAANTEKHLQLPLTHASLRQGWLAWACLNEHQLLTRNQEMTRHSCFGKSAAKPQTDKKARTPEPSFP